MTPIERDANGLAHTQFCHETADGGLDLHVGHIRYELSPERIADGPALGQTLLDMRQKRWFTDAVQCDLTNVVTARWLAKDRGWISRQPPRLRYTRYACYTRRMAWSRVLRV